MMRPLLRKIILLWYGVMGICVDMHASDIRFLHLDVTEGLSQGSVFALMQDYQGFMWLGTRDGLNKYDARKFTTYRNNPNDSTSLGHNFVQTIMEDSQKRLWIGTVNGLNLYDRARDRFIRIPLPNLETNTGTSEPSVHHMLEDRQQQLWLATNFGLYRIKEGAQPVAELVFNHIPVEIQGETTYYHHFRYVFEDSAGKLWICTDQGVVAMLQSPDGNGKLRIHRVYPADGDPRRKDPRSVCIREMAPGLFWIATKYDGIKVLNERTGTYSYHKHKADDPGTLPNNDVRSIFKDNKGRVWIGTFNGLSLYANGKFKNFYADDNSTYGLSNNSIRPIFQDKRGSIWVGTYFGGVNIIDDELPPFQNFVHLPHRNSLSYNVVSSFVEDAEGNLVIGTEGGGLNFFNQCQDHFSFAQHEPMDQTSLSHNNVKALCLDRHGNLWVGMYEGGLNIRRKGQKGFEHVRHDARDPQSLASNNIYALLEDRNGDVWIGTFGGGLQVKRQANKEMIFETFNVDNGKLLSNMIRTLFEDSKGNLWVGSGRGLYLKPAGSNHFITFLHEKGNDRSISGNDVISIHEDGKQQIWIGTYMSGLNRYNPHDRSFTRFDENDGLPGNNIFGILSDKQGNLWLSTNAGISCFNPNNQEVRNYNHIDGLIGNEFIHGSARKLQDGRFVFGSFSGFTVFHPDSILINRFEPPVVFTGLRLFNKRTLPGPDGPIKADISMIDELVLKHNQSVFSLEFSVLNYVHSEKNKYAYWLKGFDEEWNYVSVPVATYTNLDAGTYELWVKGTNNDGTWSASPTILKIKILAAPWKTWWAYTGYLLILGTVIFYIVRFLQGRNKLKQDLMLEHLAFEKQKELHEAKLNFFTHVSHEFRTPLSLLVAPIERLREEADLSVNARALLDNAQGSVHRLLNLVNQLLDFRKQESGHLRLNKQATNLYTFVSDIKDSFALLAEKKLIHLYVDGSVPSDFDVYIDRNQMEKVLTNLLFNAFKFTDAGGTIKLQMEWYAHPVGEPGEGKRGIYVLAVWDTGRGIAAEHLPYLFDEFYQSDDNQKQVTGWGIGLSLSRSLVQMHGGELSVESNLADATNSFNTVFRMTLPHDEAWLEDVSASSGEGELETPNTDESMAWAAGLDRNELETKKIIDPAEEEKPVLLVVEDNPELRAFICDSLQGSFSVRDANDGEEAWVIVKKEQPDLIISDVMMPKCDGIMFLQRIKGNRMTNHIPVILLTARTADPYVLEAFQEGTDDYIAKPFSVKLLLLKVRNMLRTRKHLEERFVQEHILQPNKEQIVVRNSFLNTIMEIMEEHLADDNFGVEDLACLVGVSRTVLYRKIKQLSGLNVVEFIKVIRLKKAAQLLETDHELTISEIAYKVGFTDPKYFSKTFKKFFGCAPSQYTERRIGKLDRTS